MGTPSPTVGSRWTKMTFCRMHGPASPRFGTSEDVLDSGGTSWDVVLGEGVGAVPNERLRSSIRAKGLSLDAVAETVQVDAKTVGRWISLDRVPQRKHRFRLAALLEVDEAHLWPTTLALAQTRAASAAEFVAIYPNRGEVPHELWHSLID